MVDRRGFFASLGAALLAPLAPLLKSPASPYDILGDFTCTLEPMGLMQSATLGCAPGIPGLTRVGTFGPLPYNEGFCDMVIPGLAAGADPFQTFVIDTNEVA